MNNDNLTKLISPIIDSIEKKKIKSATLYAFKSKKPKSDNKLISLEYEFYNTSMDKRDVVKSVKDILSYFKYKFLDKDNTVYEEYNVGNSKNVIDYINLSSLDFTKASVKKGTLKGLKQSNYKVQYLLNELETSNQFAKREKDYKGLRYSAIQLITNDEKRITIINKCSPIYNPKGWLYMFNVDSQDDIEGFDVVSSSFLRLPLYPHIIVFDSSCFFIEHNVEAIFGFEQHNKAVCVESLDIIKEELKLSKDSYSLIEKFSLAGRNPNLFADFDKTELNKIKKKDKETLAFLKQKLNIPISNEGQIDINTPKVAKNLTLFICGCILRGANNEILYQINKRTLLEV
ncbi:hypothetical protein [Clostridium sp. UBA1652]|uniref:hypothetical protein n=1 Tax=Clostridium sp. UBA1652 TaxID=1946348 RepID=UPI00257D39D7|nr:hypothetical protein [Clostridium sp. UBA1652]